MAGNTRGSEAEGLVAELRPGDGVDPREERRARLSQLSAGKRNYAVLRLARQLRDALDLEIAATSHPLLASLAVAVVEPSAACTTFVVQVYSTNPEADYAEHEIKRILEELKPRFRAGVAQEVHRKNAPDFKFDVLPPGVQPR